MNKSEKILLLTGFIPVLLTVVFILYGLMPAIDKYNTAKANIESEKAIYTETSSKIDTVRVNDRMLKEAHNLRESLADFDVKIPPEENVEVLVFDIGKFADALNTTIKSLDSAHALPVEITAPDQKVSKKHKETKETERAPASLSRIPVKITAIGSYSNVLQFISTLENYQREILINRIVLSSNSKNRYKSASKVEMSIDCSIYRLAQDTADQDNPQKEVKQ